MSPDTETTRGRLSRVINAVIAGFSHKPMLSVVPPMGAIERRPTIDLDNYVKGGIDLDATALGLYYPPGTSPA